MEEYCFDLVNQTSFGELAALFTEADLVLSVDSGPVHLASYLNKPLVSIYRPGIFERWKPWPIEASRAIALTTACQCPNKSKACIAKEHCLANISPEQVIEACDRLLSMKPAMQGQSTSDHP